MNNGSDVVQKVVAPIVGVRDLHHECNLRGVMFEHGLNIVALTGSVDAINEVVRVCSLQRIGEPKEWRRNA